MDESDVYSREALEAHRAGEIFIHHVDEAGIGYSTGVDVGELQEAQGRARSLSEYLHNVVEAVKKIEGEWAHRVTLHGLDLGAREWLDGERGGEAAAAVGDFVSELNRLRFNVSLSLNEENRSYGFSRVLADQLEAHAAQSRMAPAIVYNVTDNTDLAEEPHRRYVSHAYRYGNVEFVGTLRELGGQSLTGYVLGDTRNGGRLGVVTLNLPRIGYEARNEEDFYGRLGALTQLTVEALEQKRRAVEESIEDGRLPYTGQLQGSLEGHHSAIAVAGLNEALVNLIDAGVGHVAGKAVTYKVLEFLRDQVLEARETYRHSYSLEAYPSAEAGAFFADEDRRLYSDAFTQGEGAPYYTAASELPPSHGDDLWQALEHQKRLQIIYSGGTMMEVHLRKGIPYRDECGLLVKRIMQRGFADVKVSPVFSLCPVHGYIYGEVEVCPTCGQDARAYVWVDGQARPLDTLNEGLKEAHRQRVFHDVKAM
jgi:hypothetical protein